jgi:hypothetical protein
MRRWCAQITDRESLIGGRWIEERRRFNDTLRVLKGGDGCKDVYKTYTPPALNAIQFLRPDEDDEDLHIYTVVDHGLTFTMSYDKVLTRAGLLKITKDNGSPLFVHLHGFEQVYVSLVDNLGHMDTIEIDEVYMGNAQGTGVCTRAVAYLIKLCMMQAAKLNDWPHKGTVSIQSENPCQAFACYTHAFAMNGFASNKDDVDGFVLAKKHQTNERLEYSLDNFLNQEQLTKALHETTIEEKKKPAKKRTWDER